MSDIYNINLSILNSYRNSFNSELKNFTNNTYSTFSSSYLKNCSDSSVKKMTSELQELYNKIKKGYNNIDTWWNDYNKNIEGLEKFLSDNGSLGAISESSIRNSAIKLPNIKDCIVGIAKIFPVVGEFVVSADFINSSVSVFSDPFSSLYSDYRENIVDWVESVGTSISDGAKSLWSDVTGWLSDFKDWWGDEALPFLNEFAAGTLQVLESVGATIVLFAQSLVEGILQFGEAIIDFVALVGTAVASIVTGLIDGGQAIYGAITGNEWTSVTKQMWNGTMGFVSNQYVSGWFDLLYQNTGYGQWLAENAWGFDTVRSIGSGIGYIAGVIVLTIATLGAGSVVAAGGSVTASTAVAATTTTQMAVTATAAGIGRGTQNAWADGASLLEGLGVGTLTGLWEGLQFYLGSKISSLKFFGADGILKSVGGSEVGIKILNSLARVVLDGIDGGVEGFVLPIFNSIYKDGYYDENGNYVEFTGDDNIFERYSELFDDNGGWSAVLTQAIIGSGSSLLGELFDLSKYFKDSKKSPDINVQLTELQLKINRYKELVKAKSEFIQYLKDNDYSFKDLDKFKLLNDELLSLETGIKASIISFSLDRKNALKELSDYFGDAGPEITFLLLNMKKTIPEILDMLDGQRLIDFQNFLNNTIEGRFLASLSADEMHALTTYTGGSFFEINDKLRKKDMTGSIEGIKTENLIALIDSALEKYGVLEQPVELYRAVDIFAFTAQNDLYKAALDGVAQGDLKTIYSTLKALQESGHTEFGDLGYMSASPGYSFSFAKMPNKPIVLDIIADEGTPGAYINQISQYYNSENEFLLPRGLKLEIIDIMPPKTDINGFEKIIIKCIVGK